MKKILFILFLFLFAQQAEARFVFNPHTGKLDRTGVDDISKDITATCASGQILKSNGTIFQCGTDNESAGGGNSIYISEDGTGVFHNNSADITTNYGVGFVWTGSGQTRTLNLDPSEKLADATNSGFINQQSVVSIDVLVAVSHDAVTLAGQDFLSLSGQQITANAINPDNLANTNFGDFTCNGTNCSFNADTVSNDEIATQAVSTDQLQAAQKPIDGQFFTYEADNLGGFWRTFTASLITDQNAGTDITADLEEETHASEHESGGGDTVNHDSLTGFVTNEHIDHSSVTLTAGAGLTGGGDITTNRTFNVVSGDQSIAVSADSINVQLKAFSTNGVGSTQSPSGLETVNGGLSLLQGCSDNQIQKWDETQDDWNCEDDGGIADDETVAGNGLTETGETLDVVSGDQSIIVSSDSVSVHLNTLSKNGIGSTQSPSGLEIVNLGLSLLQGCGDNQILKWDETQDDWNCEDDSTSASGADAITVGGNAASDANFVSGDGIQITLDESTTPDNITISVDTTVARATGDVYTGAHDFSGASLELPQNDTLANDGELTLRTSRDAFIVQAGSNATGGVASNQPVASPLILHKDVHIVEPDQAHTVSQDIVVFPIEPYNYPNGIKIVAIKLTLSAAASVNYAVAKSDQPVGGNRVSIDLLTTSSDTELTETTITTSDVNSGDIIFVDLDETNINWAHVTLYYYVKN